MRTKKLVSINLIDIDRLPLHKRTLEYAIALQNGSIFPPIKLQKISNGRFRIKDGRHRYLAHKLNDKKVILAKFSTTITKRR